MFSKKIKTSLEEQNHSKESDYEEYMTIQCGGCNTILFLLRTTTEHINYGETFVLDENFPKHSDRFEEFNFLREEDQEELPTAISDLYQEVKSAFHGNASILAGIGLRTLVEAICL